MITRCPQILVFAIFGVIAAATHVCAQSNSKEIMSREAAELVTLLGKPDVSAFEKAKACQRLAVIGSEEAIPALAALLPDENLNLYARTGLEGIPGEAANSALREALPKLQGRALVGVVNSLGARRDPKSIEPLGKLLSNQDPAVSAAAARAIGRIGGAESSKILLAAFKGSKLDKVALADACLVCADEQIAAGKPAAALEIYEVVSEEAVPKYVQIAVLRAKIRLLSDKAKDLLLKQIRSEDEDFFNLGLAVSHDLSGAEITKALAGELGGLPAERQALLIKVLGERKELPGATLLQEFSKSKSAPVRSAAISVLAKIGGPEARATLLEAALTDDAVSPQARALLKNLPDKDVDSVIVSKMDGAEPRTKVTLIELIGARRIAEANPAIRKALQDSNTAVKLAAIKALGELISLEESDLLIRLALRGASTEETTAAQAALTSAAMRMSDREACSSKLAAALDSAPMVQQVFVLELLTKLAGSKALATLVAHANDKDPLKEDATRLLGEWPDSEVAPALLELAKTEKDAKYKVRALRGYIRVARQLQVSDEDRLKMFHTAIEVANRDEEKQLALDILTRIPSAATLALAVQHLQDSALTKAAADAAVKIAPKIIQSDPKAVLAAMQKVVDSKVGGNIGNKAKQLLAQANGAS